MKNKTKNQSTFSRCLKAPLRILCRARDLYVQSLTECAGRVNYGNSMPVSNLPKSFSVNSSRSGNDEDFRELIRAASHRDLRDNIDMIIEQQRLRQLLTTKSNALPRSFTVGIGRIDEDKPCDFEEDLKAKSDLLYPRSRSYAVSKRTGLFS